MTGLAVKYRKSLTFAGTRLEPSTDAFKISMDILTQQRGLTSQNVKPAVHHREKPIRYVLLFDVESAYYSTLEPAPIK